MLLVQLCKYFVCVPVAGCIAPAILHSNPMKEAKFVRDAVVTCSVAVPLAPTVSLLFWQVRRGKTGAPGGRTTDFLVFKFLHWSMHPAP